MHTWRSALAGTLLIGLLGAPPVAAGTSEPLMDALARVPGHAMDGGGIVSFTDYRAIEAARPGAPQAPTIAEWSALAEAGDPSFQIWLAAIEAMVAPAGRALEALGAMSEDWTSRLGYDFFEIDRELRFGAPPDDTDIGKVRVDGYPLDGLVLVGEFDPQAIAAAHEARDFASVAVDDWQYVCGSADCIVNPDEDNDAPADPFGMGSTAQLPFAVADTSLLASASIDTITAMRESSGGAAPSLAEDSAVRAAVGALPPDGRLRQATIIPAALLLTDVEGMVLNAATDDELLRSDFCRFALEPMPAYRLAMFADVATASEQHTTVALVYDSEDEARIAAVTLLARMDSPKSMRYRDRSLRDLFDDADVHDIATTVHVDPDGSGATAVLVLRAPLAQADLAQSRFGRSGLPYRELMDLLLERDVLWLATHSTEGLVEC